MWSERFGLVAFITFSVRHWPCALCQPNGCVYALPYMYIYRFAVFVPGYLSFSRSLCARDHFRQSYKIISLFLSTPKISCTLSPSGSHFIPFFFSIFYSSLRHSLSDHDIYHVCFICHSAEAMWIILFASFTLSFRPLVYLYPRPPPSHISSALCLYEI